MGQLVKLVVDITSICAIIVYRNKEHKMPRISKEYLSSRITRLNACLGRPVLQFASLPSESTRFSNGHICLDKNSQGYAIEEQLGESGATHCVSNRMSGSEMDIFLSGIMIGITYRNAQLIKNGHMAAM